MCSHDVSAGRFRRDFRRFDARSQFDEAKPSAAVNSLKNA
jgi:hypothetical protein